VVVITTLFGKISPLKNLSLLNIATNKVQYPFKWWVDHQIERHLTTSTSQKETRSLATLDQRDLESLKEVLKMILCTNSHDEKNSEIDSSCN
jgi:hypothetical protein